VLAEPPPVLYTSTAFSLTEAAFQTFAILSDTGATFDPQELIIITPNANSMVK
jgi:hypothetical protein